MIGVSQRTLGEWKVAYGTNPKTTAVIPNAVDIGRFQPGETGDRTTLKAELRIPDSAPLLLLVGAATIAVILDHSEASALITDREFSSVVKEALARLGRDILVIDVDDGLAEGGELLGERDYESLLAEGDP